MLEVRLSKKSFKFIKNMHRKHACQVKVKIKKLQEVPLQQDAKQLVNYNFYRVDVGEYRIVYEFDERTLFIILVGKRNDGDVYKRLKRLDG